MYCKTLCGWACLLAVMAVQVSMSSAQEPANSPASRNPGDGPAAVEPEEDEDSTIEKASFLFGYNMVTRMKNQGLAYDYDQLLAGLKAANEGEESEMSAEEQRSVLQTWQTLMRARQQRMREEQAKTNGADAEKAFEEFAARDGAKELEDGVMYVVLKDGDGDIPEAPDRVKILYEGKFTDGKVFDSTAKTGEPLVNGATQFVPGFSKAIMSMKVGSKWQVLIRGDKAYGMRPPNQEMGVNRALMFDIELVEIMPIE